MSKLTVKNILRSITYTVPYYIGVTISFVVTYVILLTPLVILFNKLSSECATFLMQETRRGIVYRTEIGACISFVVEGLSQFQAFQSMVVLGSLGYLSAILYASIVLFQALIVITPGGGFGVKIAEQDCPELFELLKEIALQLEVKNFDQVYVVPDASAAVFETNIVPLLPFKYRNLILGWLLLVTLTEQELKAVIAHELAHFDNNATLLHRSLYRTRYAIQNSLRSIDFIDSQTQIAQKLLKKQARKDLGKVIFVGAEIASLIAWGLAKIGLSAYQVWTRPYLSYLKRNNKEISYEFEYYCDRTSAKQYGGNIVINALTRSSVSQVIFENLRKEYYSQIVDVGNCYPLFHKFYEVERQHYEERVGELSPSTTTHPSLDDRAANLPNLPQSWDFSTPLIPEINRFQKIEVDLTYRMLLASY